MKNAARKDTSAKIEEIESKSTHPNGKAINYSVKCIDLDLINFAIRISFNSAASDNSIKDADSVLRCIDAYKRLSKMDGSQKPMLFDATIENNDIYIRLNDSNDFENLLLVFQQSGIMSKKTLETLNNYKSDFASHFSQLNTDDASNKMNRMSLNH